MIDVEAVEDQLERLRRKAEAAAPNTARRPPRSAALPPSPPAQAVAQPPPPAAPSTSPRPAAPPPARGPAPHPPVPQPATAPPVDASAAPPSEPASESQPERPAAAPAAPRRRLAPRPSPSAPSPSAAGERATEPPGRRPGSRPSPARTARLEGYDRLIADLRGTSTGGTRAPGGWPGPAGGTNGSAGAGVTDVRGVADPPPASRAPRSDTSEALRRRPERTATPAQGDGRAIPEPRPAAATAPAGASWVDRWESAVEDGCDDDEGAAVLEHCREQAYVYGDVAWRAALTLLLARTGRLEEARRELAATEAAVAEEGVAAAWIDVPASLGRARRLLGADSAPAPKPRKAARLRALSGSAPPTPAPAPAPPEGGRRTRMARGVWTSWEEPA